MIGALITGFLSDFLNAPVGVQQQEYSMIQAISGDKTGKGQPGIFFDQFPQIAAFIMKLLRKSIQGDITVMGLYVVQYGRKVVDHIENRILCFMFKIPGGLLQQIGKQDTHVIDADLKIVIRIRDKFAVKHQKRIQEFTGLRNMKL